MRREIKEKLANATYVEGVANIPITVDEATRIQQMIFDVEDLKEKVTKLTLMIEERCAGEKDAEIYELSKEIYLQHLMEYEQEVYLENQQEKQTEGEKNGEIIL